ncbi:hypothetical protein BAE44_0024954 [Dichanthelium oligosanthes]|uniref:PGG domain-containing protein n=1 Tax=Dichanthelium oligosanthes TaxID=888268 RepID=A0A1E5UMD4_9POAL|nr:hypothetical protein BAE44_0024954 [Dichanthelium oligosanthes]
MDQYPSVYASAPPTPGNMEAGLVTAYPPAQGTPVRLQQLGGGAPDADRSGWAGNDPNALLVVATLLTALAYLLGLSMPGGYWPHDMLSMDGGRVVYRAGDPVMRDLHRPRYWVFRASSWVGVASSMVMTLSLLARMAVASRHVVWSFAVAYSSLVLTFIVSQSRTHLSLDIIIWVALLALIWLVISLHPERRAHVIRAMMQALGRHLRHVVGRNCLPTSIAVCGVPMYPRVNPDTPPATPGNQQMGHVPVAYPPLPPEHVLPVRHPQLGLGVGGGAPNRNTSEGHDPSALLVGATLITMLAFLLGTFIPGGYWQQDTPGWYNGKRVMYRTGDPVMRDLHRPRYWVFRIASWVGVASSMVLTLSLLVRTAADSLHVRWSFLVAYSSLLLTFAVSQTKTHLSLDIIVWLAVLFVSWLITSFRGEHRARIMRLLCCGSGDN